jgi:hypothetical protein
MPAEMVHERERHMIQSLKMMVTVAWNTSGFYVLVILSKGIKFNARYYTTNILGHIMEWMTASWIKSFHMLIVHGDNARVHMATLSLDFLEANGMKKLHIHHIHRIWLRPTSFYLEKLNEC